MHHLKVLRFWRQGTRILAGAVVVAAVYGAHAETPQSRVAEIGGNQLVALRNTVSPRVARAVDQGRMNPATSIEGITMYFQPTAQQKAALDALIEAQQTPGSPYYHQWLTPAQYGSLFGMSEADLAKVQGWLTSQGFTVDHVANGRNSITFSGTAGEVENAFGTELHRYVFAGESHFANATEISVPAALGGVVLSVRGLNDFRPKPQVQFHRDIKAQVTPAFTSGQTQSHYMSPGDVATIYDVTPAYNSGETGSGQTIVILGQSAITVSDIEAFQKAAGLPVKDPKLHLTPSTGASATVQGDEAESDLDLEYASSIGKGATILFDYAGNSKTASVYNALQDAVDNNLGGIISLSYGSCELDLAQSDFATLDAIVQQGASQGQSILAASGDDGSTACYGDLTSNTTPTSQEESLAVNYPASSAYATGIGGTEFPAADVASNNTTYWQAASSGDLVSSALKYIPETAWNDDSASVGTQYGAQYALSAGGGGMSKFSARPSWQTGVPGIPSGNFRLVPDVSLDSSADVGGYLYCTSDQSAWSSGQKASCNSGFRDSSSNLLTIGGGTSFATPIFAGMVAILNQKIGSNQGPLNKQLYTLASNASTYSAVFHDITSGTIACTAGSSYCSSAGTSAYAAGAGYDEATGLGSFDFNALLSAWAGGTGGGSGGGTGGGGGGGGTGGGGGGGTGGGGTGGGGTGGGGTGSASFALTATNVTVSAGGAGTSTVTVTPANAFTGTVSFTVTASPAMTNGCYSIGNASVAGTAAVPATLTVYTSESQCSGSGVHSFAKDAGTMNRASTERGPLRRSLPVGAAALAGLLLFGFRRVRQVARSKAWTMLAILLFAVTVGFASGCGSKGGTATTTTTPTSTNVAAGSYTLTVTGSGSSVTASTTLAVTVQ